MQKRVSTITIQHSNYTVVVLIVFLLLGACTYLSIDLRNEEYLRARVSKEWQAKVDKNWGIVYDLTTSKFRKSIKRDQFLRGCRLDVKGFSIEKIELDPDKTRATVTVRFDTQYMGTPFKGMQLKENWVWEDGGWCLDLPIKPVSPFEKKK